jgi:MYXO-CTERM domain-containing protein
VELEVGMGYSKSLAVAVTLAIAAAGSGSAWAQSPQNPTGTWAAEASGAYFYYGAIVNDGTYAYLVGGYQSGASNASGDAYRVIRRYDTANNAWLTLADMPTQIYLNGGAYYGGRIYTFGNGYYGNGAIYRYTISTNSWTQLSPTLTGNRYYVQAATLGTKIYVTGGYYGGYSNLCDEFDPDANSGNGSITARANMPGGMYYHAMASVPSLNKVYSLGGYNNAYLSVMYEYDQPTDTWTTRAPISDGAATQPRYGPGAFSHGTRVYVVGGYNNGYMQTTLEYNALTNTWTQRASMSYQRYLHSATSFNGKGYTYGGIPQYTTGEEYTPPDFGLPPNEPTAVMQIGSRAETANQALADSTQFDGWTNNQIQFSANVTDPNTTQQVRFRVQVKPQNAQWTQANQVTSLATPLGAQGVHTLTYNIPADGGYDWRWRVEDAYANSHPLPANGWVEAFGTFAAQNTNSPDFRSDQLPPADPVAVAPHNVDTQVPDPVFGDVTLYWIESTDNGPVAGISYELQVATDGGFNGIEAQIFSTAGQSSYPITLTVSRFDKYWRIRARDVGGNFSSWSSPLNFRVTYNDGDDHGAGDAKKACGMSVGSVPMLGTAALGLLALGAAFLRRRR